MVLIKCAHCEEAFDIPNHWIRKGRGRFCSKACYAIWLRRPDVIMARFWKTVDIRGENECWEWLGGRGPGGYGRFSYCTKWRKVHIKAHRFAYIISIGKIHKGLLACHSCDNPPCCNPDHVFIGTYQDNAQDMLRKGRRIFPSGEVHPSSKITTETALAIFKLGATGISQGKIGKIVGLSQTHVGRILRGERWSHLNV